MADKVYMDNDTERCDPVASIFSQGTWASAGVRAVDQKLEARRNHHSSSPK
jgi:hypothetical protein